MAVPAITNGEKPMRRSRKAFKALFTSILVLAAVAFLGVGVAARTGHLHLQTVLSGSMRPGTQPGDLIATWKVPTSSLHPGDVIVFYPPGNTTKAEMHRIVSIQQTKPGTYKVITKGDANSRIDPWNPVLLSSPDAYRRVAVVPGLGWVSVWAGHVPLQPVLFIIGGVLFLWIAATKALSGDSRKGRTGAIQFFIVQDESRKA